MITVQKKDKNTGIIVNEGYASHFIIVPTDDIPATVEKMLKTYLEIKGGK